MKVTRRKNHKKIKKPVIIAGIVLLLALGVILTKTIVQSLGNNGPLALKERETFTLNDYDNLTFDVTFSNSKSLNKVIEQEITSFVENNKDRLTADVSFNVLGHINEKNKFMTLTFEHGSENVKEVYKTSNIDLNNYEVIVPEDMFFEDLRSLSMLVREALSKDESLTYNKEMYLKTLPEVETFKYVLLSEEGMTFLFSKDAFNTEEYKTATVPYEDVLPSLSDDLARRINDEFVRPDLSNVRYIDPTKPMVAVTYDDGPLEKTSMDIAKHYADNNSRLTFFWLGQRIEQSPDVVKSIYDMGHETANHSYDHSNFNNLNDEELEMQTKGVNDKIKEITGQERVLIRPPYGSADDNVKSKVKSPMIMWSVDTEDWSHRDEDKTYEAIEKYVFDGAIILMHDLYETSTNAGKRFLDKYKNEYQFLTITELHQYKGIPLVDGNLHFGSRGY